MLAGLIATGFLVTGAQAGEKTRSPRELREAVDAALARESRSSTTADRAAVVRDLATLAKELAEHPTMANSAVISLQGRIRARLERMQSQFAKAAKPAGKNPDPKHGPNDILAQVAPGGAADPKKPDQGVPLLTEDNGEALAQLIRETIAAETWVENGGNGVIVYFPSLRALVVRQAGDVHEGLGDLIGQLHP
jgi:hypothetical protein